MDIVCENLVHPCNTPTRSINQDINAVADHLWVKDRLDPDEENLRFSN
jgi:hypothetical protein